MFSCRREEFIHASIHSKPCVGGGGGVDVQFQRRMHGHHMVEMESSNPGRLYLTPVVVIVCMMEKTSDVFKSHAN